MGFHGIQSLANAFRCKGLSNVTILWIDNNPNIGKNGISYFFKNTFQSNILCSIKELKMGGTMCHYKNTIALPSPKVRPFVETYKKKEEQSIKEVDGNKGEKVENVKKVKKANENVENVENVEKAEKADGEEKKLESVEKTASVWTILGQSISMNKTLVTLDICEELSMNDDACADISPGLIQNVSIQNLLLEGNNINDEGAALISDVLIEQKTLTYVSLRRNHISDEGALALSDSLVDNNSLLVLDIAHNDIDTKGRCF
jgi:hypothetical protein